jgi:hypothetical protein
VESAMELVSSRCHCDGDFVVAGCAGGRVVLGPGRLLAANPRRGFEKRIDVFTGGESP